MSERWARAALQTYRWLGSAFYPFIGTYVAIRASRGKEEHGRRRERYGRNTISRPEGSLVWVHAASVGETGAVAALIARLRGLGIEVVLTTGTVTSANFARERLGEDLLHQYVPLDIKPAVSRFLHYWKPDLAIFAESEIWPMTILELGARRIPQVLINGRMSDRSFKRWKKRLALAESLFENLSHVAAQTELDAERFRTLGARPVTVTGNLKVDVELPPVDNAVLNSLLGAMEGRPRWAAISTHEGEEVISAKVHRALRKFWPGLLTIVVPRHPDRAPALRKMFEEHGLKVCHRSEDTELTSDADVFLGDSIGEMGLYLRLTDIAFVGKSLSGTGGQNPLEPAMLGTAILSGPNVSSFAEIYDRLCEAKGARIVADETLLAKTVHHLLLQPKACAAMARAGARVVDDLSGALDLTWQSLDPYIHPLRVQAALKKNARDDGEDGVNDRQTQEFGHGWT
ncbi:lipid IV(A) 3-deoxy-D-manno-octulosonic acid transferase [Oricola cellulosilytica]|uniref:3-deoxy-D-manno-octulosonic acid transferase n=1 Tax=Oricola cellulosilytica TaxID=1429082 RepID=A0A4R0PFM7_9HYPH|nr:lipid IV(A) 3-deoxy-D-manno-octulosonic acid transferase [Oricola cellulosilytica]TCD16647.1 3-deoxy-D-manno-octulosonic acid transferase [Oricola cellulosilytica]